MMECRALLIASRQVLPLGMTATYSRLWGGWLVRASETRVLAIVFYLSC